MTDREREEKFEHLAEGEMHPRRREEVLERLWALEAETDLGSLLALFRPVE
jgi:hypothetical protein